MEQQSANTGQRAHPNPDKMQLNAIQAQRLSSLTGIDRQELRKGTIVELADRLRWRIDPSLFLFERVCGQVVKTDPSTGIDHPVPFATVHVQDVDCSFLGFFPIDIPWAWLFPFFCYAEDLAVVQTDACGRFCAWIPRFEIDWILRWRRERFCFPELLRKPSIRDILEHLKVIEQGPVIPHGPGPVESALRLRQNGGVYQHLQALVGSEVASRIGAAAGTSIVGGNTKRGAEILDKPAFPNPVPPPLPRNTRERFHKEGSEGTLRSMGVDVERLVSSARAGAAQGKENLTARLDWNHYLGPFIRCYDYWVPEWTPIVDVPDITFWVQQDVNGDGTLETIYSENYFDVRWDSPPIPDVSLHASAIAVASPMAADDPSCSGPKVPCEEPAIVLAGLMPVQNLPAPADPYLDQTAGYAQRPNKPHPRGLVGETPPPHTLATAPFCGTVQLYGCNQYEGGGYYRLLYTYRAPGSVTTSSAVPFQNLTWQLWRWVGSPGHLELLSVGPDSNGWYPILNEADGWMPGRLLLNWPTGDAGVYTITMQFADGGKNYIAGSDTSPVALYVDNTSPTAVISEIRWRVAGGAWSSPLPRVCGVVMRPKGQNIEFRVSYTASALHLRDLALSGSGCGGGDPLPEGFPNWSDPPSPEFDGSGISLNPYSHWHTDPNDNSISRTAIFSLAGAAPQGAYDFSLGVNSRAFNPAGGDGGFEADWNYDVVYRWTPDYWKLAVIDV